MIGREAAVDTPRRGHPRKHRLALVVAPHLFADALAAVLAADDVDEVIDLTAYDSESASGPIRVGPHDHFDAAVVSPGAPVPDADVVIVLPPSGTGEVVVRRRGVEETERVDVPSVAALFDVLDEFAPGAHRRRRP